MRKEKLSNFISKYNLGGLCNQVKIVSKDRKLLTSFSTEQKDLLGFVGVSDVDVNYSSNNSLGTDFEFGIFNTQILSKFLSAMQNEVVITFNEELGKIVSMDISDTVMTGKVMLADLDIIEKVPTVKELPQMDVKIELTPTLIDQYIKAKNALPDSEVVAFVHDSKNQDILNLVVNYAEHNTDKITLNLPITENSSRIDAMKFNANVLKEVFSANKDCTTGSIELSSQGLMTINFSGEGFNSRYLLVMIQ